MNKRVLLIVAVALFLFYTFWMGRYTISPVHTSEAVGAYKLDKFTGKVTLLIGNSEVPVSFQE
jgi:hypothetical protein